MAEVYIFVINDNWGKSWGKCNSGKFWETENTEKIICQIKDLGKPRLLYWEYLQLLEHTDLSMYLYYHLQVSESDFPSKKKDMTIYD